MGPELALQRIEAQFSLVLSRQIGTPNIASKGKLAPRPAIVPLALFPVTHASRAQAEKSQKKLIEEVELENVAPGSVAAQDAAKAPKGILKSSVGAKAKVTSSRQTERPKFEWTKEGERIKITVGVPKIASQIRS